MINPTDPAPAVPPDHESLAPRYREEHVVINHLGRDDVHIDYHDDGSVSVTMPQIYSVRLEGPTKPVETLGQLREKMAQACRDNDINPDDVLRSVDEVNTMERDAKACALTAARDAVVSAAKLLDAARVPGRMYFNEMDELCIAVAALNALEAEGGAR